MNFKKLFIVLLIAPFLLVGCKDEGAKDIELNLEYQSINKVEVNDTKLNVPFTDEVDVIIKDMVDLLNSTTYMEKVDKAGTCDAGIDTNFYLYTEDDTYKIIDVSGLDTCQPLILVIKNNETLGYTSEISTEMKELYDRLNS